MKMNKIKKLIEFWESSISITQILEYTPWLLLLVAICFNYIQIIELQETVQSLSNMNAILKQELAQKNMHIEHLHKTLENEANTLITIEEAGYFLAIRMIRGFVLDLIRVHITHRF